MPITSIPSQPINIAAAYAPIAFEVYASRTDGTPKPPVVYCDIYFNDEYYKTMEKTQYVTAFGDFSAWIFDIQDAAQEYLSSHQVPYAVSAFVRVPGPVAKCYCKFRSSGLDTDGFILGEGAEPVQATGSVPAQGGEGTQSATFYVVNATLQHLNRQPLQSHLYSIIGTTAGYWNNGKALPICHRPATYFIDLTMVSDFYPVLMLPFCTLSKYKLIYRLRGSDSSYDVTASGITIASDDNTITRLVYAPAAPNNLNEIFPTIQWGNIDTYYFQGLDVDNNILFTTNTFKLHKCLNPIRIKFLNYLGTWDSIQFDLPKVTHEDTSSEYKKSLPYPGSIEAATTERFNVRSIDTYEVIRKCREEEMRWVQELKDSPKAYIELNGEESIVIADGQGESLIPIVIIPGKMEKLKNDKQYEYLLTLSFKLAYEYQTIRN